MGEVKRTPIFPEYEKLGAKTIDFGGWDLPVQFSSIKEEHHATREKAGLFDVSHMGEVTVTGPDSEAFLQKMVTNDVSKLNTNQAHYTAMCYPDGGTVDDFLIYKRDEEDYLLVVNAANTEKDYEWLVEHQEGSVEINNISEDLVQLALQGPNAQTILQKITSEDLSAIKFFRFKDDVKVNGVMHGALISRTGYTGEDGFEIYINRESGVDLWNAILEAGDDEGLQAIGLGARDTLRFEANLALYGQELTKDITPIEAGIGFAVKINKEINFIGKEVLKEQKENGPKRKLVGIEMIDKGIPRNGYPVMKGEEEVGFVTSGTQSPTLGKNIGLALVNTQYANQGEELQVKVRKRTLNAQVVPTPFYKRK
ncbi:glycine cleavage system aminomethyltransferase GcvT [Alkalibacillus haloalkaliphilus]|uniref:glycine cleavage system aminomethyltransferase GcvT n=1 Tax=Alkalibacillus haloalkaliphilus TaxID=94136 RepID=UPI0029354C6A|nr:glycine cleavage system aminomethyltransferase GcvT [Alkalibacillus haloalkaliphilus]MDV2580970.1 glycine cleavage system aminomethyltransferase GcvT [Alkalibacillus haloalkaliphilus]